MKKLIIFIVLLFVSVTTSFAQEIPELITDRPDITESAVTVPQNALQIETGFQYEKQNINENSVEIKNENFTYASTLFRYGINDKLEFRFGGQYFSGKSSVNGVESITEGLEDISIGSKLNIFQNGKIIDDFALLIEFTLPFGNYNLRPDKVEPAFIAAFSKTISDPLEVSANVGIKNENQANKTNIFYSTSFGYSISDRFGLFAEYYGDASKGSLSENNIDFGLTYLQKRNIQIDISVGSAIFKNENNWFARIGFSLRLPT